VIDRRSDGSVRWTVARGDRSVALFVGRGIIEAAIGIMRREFPDVDGSELRAPFRR
jgi:hypothetical protein